MIFTQVPLEEAEGALLAHGQLVGDTRWPKGRILTASDLVAARAAGLSRLTVARLDPDDIGEDAAASQLATALAGPGTIALPPAHGRANLAATADGVLTLDPESVNAINLLDEALTLGTLPPHSRVAAGDIIATIKIIRYAVAGPVQTQALGVARPLAVHPFRARHHPHRHPPARPCRQGHRQDRPHHPRPRRVARLQLPRRRPCPARYCGAGRHPHHAPR